MLTKKELIDCLCKSIGVLNGTKGLHLKTNDIEETTTDNWWSQTAPVFKVKIESTKNECGEFEIVAERESCGQIYKDNKVELYKLMIETIWKKYKAAKFEKFDEQVRQDIFSKLTSKWDIWTKNSDFGIPIKESNKHLWQEVWNDNSKIYTKAEIDKLWDED